MNENHETSGLDQGFRASSLDAQPSMDQDCGELNPRMAVLEQIISGIADTVEKVLLELVEAGGIGSKQIIIIGTSTSEVLGYQIGTSGTVDVAREIFEGVERARQIAGFYPVFQCCEHLNRALVAERELLKFFPALEPVTAVPIPKAGGAMAAYAYRTFRNPVVLESVKAHGGLDIGGTLIGMHLKSVAVPVRPSIRTLGHAHMQMAYSRPKLIGGERAVYRLEADQDEGDCF